jgi:hypothetical protein
MDGLQEKQTAYSRVGILHVDCEKRARTDSESGLPRKYIW